ncbi:MAG: LysR family transcriptional regulator [Clostridia bacterium]|nr:LysR family transcriptional regulator [Clostridia bacterium]
MYINLNHYRTFWVVAQSKSYADASNKLNVTKTAIAKNIQQLEDQLNTKLFYRESRGVKLTADGETFYKFVDRGFSEIEAGEKLIAQKNNIETGEIIIGALSHIADFLLIDKIQEVKSKYPELKVKLTTGATGKNLIELLEDHKIDFAVDSTSMNIKNKDIVKEELMEVENIFIAKKPTKINDIKDLANLKLVLGGEFTHTTQDLINALKEYGVSIKPSVEIDITELRISAAKKGIGISYVMKESVKEALKNKEVYEVKMPIKLPVSKINLIYLKEQLNKADKQFIKEYLKK